MGVSVEELLASAPDLVLASTNISSNQEMLPTLEAAGIKVAFFLGGHLRGLSADAGDLHHSDRLP